MSEKKVGPSAGLLFIGALTLLPVLRLLFILASVGADNLSNDYLAYVGLIDQMLDGTYDWTGFVRDTFYRTHSVAIPVLLHLADARFFHFSVYPEIYFGVALSVVRLLMIHQTLAVAVAPRQRAWLWPALSFMIFSTTQLSVFAYGDASLTIGLALFGFTAGIWALTVRPRLVPAPVIMLLAGLTASFSWANGLVSWLIFLIALVALGYRKVWHYGVWALGVAISVSPYIVFLLVPKLTGAAGVYAGTMPLSFFNWRFVVNALGWPFCNEIGYFTESLPCARTIGWTGLALTAIVMALLSRPGQADARRRAVPALLFAAHGLVSIWQISVFRSLIASWYTAVAMNFWVGLIGLAALFLAGENKISRPDESGQPEAGGSGEKLAKLSGTWARCVIFVLAVGLITSSRTYEDKADMLFARAPVSESALRHFRTAPTYAERHLFQWGVGNPDMLTRLAGSLEKHRLSAFAPHQVWTLQGDYLLDSVRVHEPADGGRVIWTDDDGPSGAKPWFHFNHLNVMIPEGASVSWVVTVPADVQLAELNTAFKSADADGTATAAAIAVRSEGGQSPGYVFGPTRGLPERWLPVSVPLESVAGRKLAIRFETRGGNDGRGKPIVFRYPVIVIHQDAPPGRQADLISRPANTDLSPDAPARTAADLIIKPESPGFALRGGGVGMMVTRDGVHWRPNSAAFATERSILNWGLNGGLNGGLNAGLDAELSRYSHFQFRLAEPASTKPRAVTVVFKTGSGTEESFQVPLLPDGGAHTYSYDLKLLDLPRRARLQSLGLELPSSGDPGQRLIDVRLIARPVAPAAKL